MIHESVAYGGSKYTNLQCNGKDRDKDRVIILFLVGLVCNCFTMYFEENLFVSRIWDINKEEKGNILFFIYALIHISTSIIHIYDLWAHKTHIFIRWRLLNWMSHGSFYMGCLISQTMQVKPCHCNKWCEWCEWWNTLNGHE